MKRSTLSSLFAVLCGVACVFSTLSAQGPKSAVPAKAAAFGKTETPRGPVSRSALAEPVVEGGFEIHRDGRGKVLAIRNPAAARAVVPQAKPARLPLDGLGALSPSKRLPWAAGKDAAAGSARLLTSAATRAMQNHTGQAAHDLFARAGAHLAPHVAHFGAAMGELRAVAARTDHLGMSHVHYRQQHGGVPVYGSELIVHLGPDGGLSSVNARLLDFHGAKPGTAPAIRAGDAAAAAIALAGQQAQAGAKAPEPQCCGGDLDEAARKGLLESRQPPRLWLYNEGFVSHQPAETPTHLVWEVILGAQGGKVSETFFIDATDSSLVKRRSNVQRLNRKVWDCTNHKNDGQCRIDTFSSAYTDESLA